MKKLKLIIALTAFVFAAQHIFMNQLMSYTNGPPAGRCGAPGDGGTTCISCHGAGASSTGKTVSITSNIPTAGYTAGTTYTITVTMTVAGGTSIKCGFQMSPQTTSGVLLGTLIATSSQTSIVSNKYIQHNGNGVYSSNGVKTWTFDWTAPAAAVTATSTTFYGAFNFTNGSGSSVGDYIAIQTFVVQKAAVAPTAIATPIVTGTQFCLGQSFNVSSTTTGTFGANNTFVVQLSDGAGSFVTLSPTIIGTSGIASSIACVMPTSISGGNLYRIRVVSSSPVVASADNGVDITIFPSPVISISGNIGFCAGSSTTLTLNSASSYFWSNTATTQSINITNAGTFIGRITDVNGCLTYDTVLVTQNPLPTVAITGLDTVCESLNPTTLSATTGMASYLWIGGETTQSITAFPGTYTVTATDANGCTNTAMFTQEVIMVPAIPTINFTNNILSVTTENNVTYQWTLNGQNIANATDTSLTTSNDGLYNVVLTNPCGSVTTAVYNLNTVNVGSINNEKNAIIYPNPATTKLFIQASLKLNSVILFDVLGNRIICDTENNNGLITIDITTLAKGIYTLYISENEKVIQKTFIKN